MSVFTNFNTAVEDIITSERQAEFATLIVDKLYEKLRADDYGIIVDYIRNGDPSVSLILSPIYNALPFVEGDDCSITECDVTPDYTAKKWELVMAECRYPLCTRSAPRQFMALYGQYKAIRPDDSEYDFLIEQMSDILADVLANSLVAKLFLADKAYTEDTLNGTNGFISQWKLEADNILDLTEVAGVTPTALDGEAWYNIAIAMKEKYESMPFKKSIADAQFVLDEVAARQIVNMLNGLERTNMYDCSCLSADGMVRSDRFTVEGLQIAGIPVKTIPYTDMVAQFDELMVDGDPVNPIFAVLTPKSEVQIGTPREDELDMNESFYDKKDRKFYFDVGYQFGAMVPSNHFIIADLA